MKTAKPRHVGKPKEKKKVICVHGEEEVAYAFSIISASPPEKVEVIVGGITVAMVTDSGASTNVIDKSLWSELKQKIAH